MTTIACDRTSMAADSQSTRDSGMIVSFQDRKVRRIREDIVACQGNEDQVIEFENWYEAGCKNDEKPDLEEYFAALVLTSEGRIFKYFERCTPVELFEDFTALGSGEELAIGAMAAGATPTEAVEIACRFNVYTGLPVITEKLDDSTDAP